MFIRIKINVEVKKIYLSQYTLNSLDNQVFQIKQNGNLTIVNDNNRR